MCQLQMEGQPQHKLCHPSTQVSTQRPNFDFHFPLACRTVGCTLCAYTFYQPRHSTMCHTCSMRVCQHWHKGQAPAPCRAYVANRQHQLQHNQLLSQPNIKPLSTPLSVLRQPKHTHALVLPLHAIAAACRRFKMPQAALCPCFHAVL